LKTQPATGETYPKSDLFNKADLLVKTVKLTPEANQDLEDIWYYGYHHFDEERAERYINLLSRIFCF
ncbi:type II toxin-antitoxin system RelE/ParE family toxin, partial [Klebsiella pneumoniae]|uniref:type II toxin-antitoxin system RelE/ParE family toxin n=1 Tax=Klebsiella pneumoniae TaxID=573 RepID=UPI0035BC64E5